MNNLLLNVDASTIVFLLFIFIIVVIFAAIPVVLSVLFYKWLTRLGYKYIAIAVLVPVYVWLAYSIYTAIYPTDEIYYEEFKTVTLREIPESAVIVKKTASYSDFHGDYISVSRIKLSKQDYNKLLNALKADKRLHKGEIVGSTELNEIIGKVPPESQIANTFNRNIPNHEDHYLNVFFLKDGQTIVVQIIVT